MRTFALIVLAAAAAAAAPVSVRQLLVGQPDGESKSVNGPSAISNPTINNGASKEGSVNTSTSLDGALISNPIGNTVASVNKNIGFHDNTVSNAEINVVSDAEGLTVVGNGNQVFDDSLTPDGILLKRGGPADASSVNAPVAANNPIANSGALQEGSTDANLSLDGASVVNPIGNSLAQVNDNTDIVGNNIIDPNANVISDNNGPAVAGNDNDITFINNEGMIVNLDSDFLAQQQAQQLALIDRFAHHGLF
ncbi:hypothetical protein GQ54DRAFT_34577 [Martensiomyces pterosporus]|nr:hypothetical protein GQ54DRAFT_34577 [Martensiomyces pterosporus]